MLGLIQHYFKCNQYTSRVQNTILPHLLTPSACVRNRKLPKFSPLSPQSILAVLQRNGRVRIPHYLESIPITYPFIAEKDKAHRKWDKCAEITAYDWVSAPTTVSESIWDEMVLLGASSINAMKWFCWVLQVSMLKSAIHNMSVYSMCRRSTRASKAVPELSWTSKFLF